MKQYFTLQYWKGQRLLLLAFLLMHVVVAAIHISKQDITFDEYDYYNYSVRWLHGDVERTNKMFDSKTPLVVVAAIPRVIKQIFNPGYTVTDFGKADIRAGRYFMVVFTIIIAVYLFVWIRKLFGGKAWIFPLLFFLFDPLVIGYSMIITSDMASGACLLATSYHLFAFYKTRRNRQLILFSIWLALSFVCKASLLFLLPYLFFFALLLIIRKRSSINLKKAFAGFIFSALIVLTIMNLSYFGKGTLQTLESSSFKSSLFRSLSGINILNDIPVPLPFSYLRGLDMLSYHGEIGAGHVESTHHGTYLNEETKYQGGFWNYYLYVGFYKIPIATLILAALGSFFAVRYRRSFVKKYAWYVLPFVFYFIILSFFNPFQTGFRHFLIIYPLLFLLVATAVNNLQQKIRGGNIIISALFAYMIVSSLLYYPNLLAYTNEFLADKKTVFKKINDSSIDYGQGQHYLKAFIIGNSEYELMPLYPKPGKFIISASQLFDRKSQDDCSWLSSFIPVDHYHYSNFIFHITEADLLQTNKGQQ